jgi:hypothetical protein
MTVSQILERLRPIKPMSKANLYKQFLKPLNIRPRGKIRQCPEQYPDDSAERILAALGMDPSPRKNSHAHPWRAPRNRHRNPKLSVKLTKV